MKKLRLKKWHKVVLYTIGAILLIAVVGTVYVNHVVSKIIEEKLDKGLDKMKRQTLRYDKIRVNILTESISIYGLYYSTALSESLPQDEEGYEVFVDRINIDHIDVLNVLKTKRLDINNITIIEPQFMTNVGLKKEQESEQKSDMEGYKMLLETIASLNIDYVDIVNAKIHVKGLQSKLELYTDSINISVNNLKYKLNDSILSYNDSVYQFEFKNMKFIQPNGRYAINIKSIKTKNEGELVLKDFRYWCLLPKDKVAELNGNVPTAWNDIYFDEIKTTKINIIKKVLEGKIELDSLNIKGRYINVYKDNIPPPTRVKKMLQQSIMSIKEPIYFKHILVKLPVFLYQEIDRDTDVGEIELNYLTININNFKNELNNTVYINAQGSIRNGGMMNVNLDLDLNPKCNFKCKAVLTDCDGTAFNPFLTPIVGAEIKKCNIDYVYTRFSGDSASASGVFTMAYQGFNAKILKSGSPYAVLTKNRGAINLVSQLLIPESNPKEPGGEPRSFTIDYERNIYKPFGNYLIMTLLDGVKKTLVPSFYLENQVKIIRSIHELSKLDKQAKEKRLGRHKGYNNKKVLELDEKLKKLNKKLRAIVNEQESKTKDTRRVKRDSITDTIR